MLRKKLKNNVNPEITIVKTKQKKRRERKKKKEQERSNIERKKNFQENVIQISR